jgi:hypothetical protein
VKIFRNGWFCAGMIWLAAGAAWAQQETAAGQEAPQQQTTPPAQQPPAQQPPAQQPPAQQPPAQQPPAQQPQQPTPPEQAGTQQNLRLPPPPPKVIDVRMPGEAGISIGLTGWQPIGDTYLDKGHDATFSGSSLLKLAGQSHGAFGAEVGVAAGLHNQIKVGYFFSKTSGSTTAPTDLVVFGQTFSKGEPMTTNAKLSDAKISFEYLTWPYPVERRHFRLKTLWQVQYVTMRAVYDDPVKSATPDSGGNITSVSVLGSKSYFTPAFGLGLHEYATRSFHFEADISGFAWPHRFQLVDSEVTIGYRVGHIAVRGGVKYFHFRSSPQQDYFYRANLVGAFVGVRWHSD